MKRVLGVLAAGILAVAPLAVAFADEHGAGATAEVKVEGAVGGDAAVAADADVAAKPAVREFMMSDGVTKFYVENDVAYTLDADGNKVPVAEGSHTLAGGAAFEVKDGKAIGLPAAEAAGDAAAEGSAHTEMPAVESTEGAGDASGEAHKE